jgi:hypothetical protein
MSADYQPDHFLNPAPPIWQNRVRCFVFSHDWTLYAFNHWTLQADLICVACSRTITFDLASLTPEIQEVGSVEELIAPPNGPERIDPGDLHRRARFVPEDATVEEH